MTITLERKSGRNFLLALIKQVFDKLIKVRPKLFVFIMAIQENMYGKKYDTFVTKCFCHFNSTFRKHFVTTGMEI